MVGVVGTMAGFSIPSVKINPPFCAKVAWQVYTGPDES